MCVHLLVDIIQQAPGLAYKPHTGSRSRVGTGLFHWHSEQAQPRKSKAVIQIIDRDIVV
jgi:hypothetical protein